MDIKKIISELIEKLKSNPDAVRGLQSEPTKTIKDLTGIDLPEDQVNSVLEGVMDKLGDGLGDKLDGLKNLFNK
jgi:hypothetical protein